MEGAFFFSFLGGRGGLVCLSVCMSYRSITSRQRHGVLSALMAWLRGSSVVQSSPVRSSSDDGSPCDIANLRAGLLNVRAGGFTGGKGGTLHVRTQVPIQGGMTIEADRQAGRQCEMRQLIPYAYGYLT